MTNEPLSDPARLIGQSYDTVAHSYALVLRDELDGKPLDRAMLAAVVEMAAGGPIVDLGCGPGHVTAYLRSIGGDAVGIDISRSLIAIAREDHPEVPFEVESMMSLSAPDDTFAAAVLLFSIIHLSAADRDAALAETLRTLRPGGVALIAFHIRSEEVEPGEKVHRSTWFGHSVDLDGYYLEPDDVIEDVLRVGFDLVSVMTRMPHPNIEVQTERAYLLVQKPTHS